MYLNVSGTKFDDGFSFTTFTFQGSKMLIVYQLSKRKIFYGQSEIHEGNNFLFELSIESPDVLIYFLGEGLQMLNESGLNKTSPPLLYLDFDRMQYDEEKEKAGSHHENGWFDLLKQYKRKADKTYVFRKLKDGTIQVEDNMSKIE